MICMRKAKVAYHSASPRRDELDSRENGFGGNGKDLEYGAILSTNEVRRISASHLRLGHDGSRMATDHGCAGA